MSMTPESRRLWGLATWPLTLLLVAASTGAQQPEIPEHPKPGNPLPPGFVSPEAPFEERIIWDDEKPGEADFIPQALFDRYSLEDLPLSDKQRESLESTIRMSRPIKDPPPYPWWKPMPKCSSIQHDDGSPPGPNALGYAELVLEFDAAVIGQVVAIVPGWDTGWDRVTRAIYFRVVDILWDRHHVVNQDQTIATTLVGGEITIDGVEVCTYESKDFRSKKVGDHWLILGETSSEQSSFDAWLILPVEDGQVLPQPIYRLKDREPIGLDELKAQLEEWEQ